MKKGPKTPEQILEEVEQESQRKNFTFSLREQLMKDFFKIVGEKSRSRVVEKLVEDFVASKLK